MFTSLKHMKESLRPLTEEDQNLISEAIDKYYENGCQEFNDSVTSYVMVDEDGETRTEKDRACHAGVSTSYMTPLFVVTMNGTEGREELIHPIYGDKVEKLSLEDVTPFRNWVLTSDIFGPYIVDYTDDLFVVRADIPANYLQNVLIVTRHFKECSHRAFQAFNKMTSNGTPPEVAYLVCFGSNLSKIGSEKDISQIMFSAQTGHRVFSSNLTLESLSRMLKGTFQPNILNGRRSEGTLNFDQGRRVFGEHSYDMSGGFLEEIILKDEGLRQHLSSFRKDLFKEVFIPNPFKPVSAPTDIRKEKPHKLTIEEAIDVVVPYITENKLLERYL